ncbi:MAG: hypothetical protein WA151_05055 [Desulfatirhabdiaceae bacterium]
MHSGAVLSETFPALTSNGMFSGALISEVFTAIGTNMVSGYEGTAGIDHDFPALTSSMYSGAYIDEAFTALTTAMSSLVGSRCRISDVFPELTSGGMFSGATIDDAFPPMTGAMASTTVHFGSIQQMLPAITGAATAKGGTICQIDSGFPALTCNLHAFTDIAATIEDALPAFSIHMTSRSEIICNIADTFPALSTSISAIVGISAIITEIFPALTSFIVSRTGAACQTFCMDILKKELVSKFTNYKFDSYGIVGGRPLGGNPNGLFLLEGDTDNGGPILSTISTPALNFGSYLRKKLRAFRLGGKFNGNMTISVTNGDTIWPVTIAMVNGMKPGYKQEYFTNSTRGEYLTFTVTNPDGTSFLLDEISLYMMFLERR